MKRLQSVLLVGGAVFVSSVMMVSSTSADRFSSTNYVIDASGVGNSAAGGQSSTNYQLTSAGGESAIGNGTSGSYKLGQGYVAQLENSIQIAIQPSTLSTYYPFVEGSGTQVSDSEESENPLEFVGSPTWGAGKIGGGITVSASNYLRSTSSSPTSGSAFTACAWSNVSSTGTDSTILAQSDATLSANGMWSLGYLTATTRPQVLINLGGSVQTVTSATSLGTGSWHHICAGYNGTVIRLFVDGVQTNATTVSNAFSMPSTYLTVGARNGAGYLLGSLDEVKIYDAAYTEVRVAAEYQAQNAGIPAGTTLQTVIAGTSNVSSLAITALTDALSYQLSTSQDHDLQSGANAIPSVPASIAAPVGWAEGATKGLGFSISSINSGILDPKWAGGNSFAAFPSSPTTFISHSGDPGSRDIYYITLRLDVQSFQTSGDYQNTVTWTGTITP